MNSPRRKNLSPTRNLTLPELLKPKMRNMTQSRTSKAIFDIPIPKSRVNLQLKSQSSRDSHFSLTSDYFENRLSDDLKKLNSFFIDSSLNKTFLKEFVYEEPPHGPPAERRDAKMLMEWLDFMLQTVQNERIDNPKQLFDMANEIYSVCFVEIIKQVTAHCKERGYLISRVWKAYQTLFAQALKISQTRYQNLCDSLTGENSKVQESLQDKINKIELELYEQTCENESLRSELETQSALVKTKTEKEVKLLNNFSILQTQYKIAKRELLTLREDARILKVRYENIGAEDEFNNVVKRLIIPKRFKRRTSDELDKELSRDPLVNDFLSDSDSDLFDKITKYGKWYIEKSIEILFNRDDFVERGIETIRFTYVEQSIQTDVQDLCGEAIGVKKRQSKLAHASSIRSKVKQPMYFPEFRPYNQRTLTVEAHKLAVDPYSQDLKKKHNRVRRLLSTIRNVRFIKNLSSELNFEDIPHSHVLSGLLRNLTQASQIISSHPLESLPDTVEEVEEETEILKKRKIIQAVISPEDEKKERLKESDAANTLRKVSHTPVHKLKNVMFKKMLLKLILYFYEERMKESLCNEHFCDFVYNSLMKKYIMKRAAESKYHHLLASCVKYKSIIRVRVFGRFLGLYEGFDSDDLQFYIECFQFFQGSQPSEKTVFSESLEIVWVHYSKCVECIKYYERVLPKSEIPTIKLKLEKMKKDDRTSKQAVVDLDEFLEQLVETHNDHNKSTKHFMECIYGAADLNDDGYLQYKEFELLMRFLSVYTFRENIVKSLFEEYGENFLSEEDDEVKAISFENLCQMNLTHKVFQANSVKIFTGILNGEEALKKLEGLEDHVEDLVTELHWRFSETQTWEEHIDELSALLSIIKEKIHSKRNPEKTYLAYCLVDSESKRVIVDERLVDLLPRLAKGFR